MFDLARLDALSDEPSLAFLMSARTAYVLQNLAAADVMDGGRYAVELADNGYFALQDDDEELDLFDVVIDGVQRELIPMPNWDTWVPVLWQNPTNPITVSMPISAAFLVDPRGVCDWYINFVVQSSGTAGEIAITGPNVAPSGEFLVGRFLLLDAGTQYHVGAVVFVGGNSYRLFVDGAGNYLGLSPAFQLAAGDALWMHCRYRTESG